MGTVTDVRTVYAGALVTVQRLTVANGQGVSVQREVVRHPGAVLIVPALSDSSLVMIRNRRVAVDETLWEFPAGKLEPGEIPERAAARELAEETGYLAAHLAPLGAFYTSPGFTDELMHVFVANRLTLQGQHLEPGEDIEVEIVSVDDAMDMVRRGTIKDGKSIAGLLMWSTMRTHAGIERRSG